MVSSYTLYRLYTIQSIIFPTRVPGGYGFNYKYNLTNTTVAQSL